MRVKDIVIIALKFYPNLINFQLKGTLMVSAVQVNTH